MARALRTGLDWQVRYTWECVGAVVHPKFTYSEVRSENLAIAVSESAVRQVNGTGDLTLVEVHRRHVSERDWTKVEQPYS